MTLDAYKALVEEHFHDIENLVLTPWRKKVGENSYRASCGCVYNSSSKITALSYRCRRNSVGGLAMITHDHTAANTDSAEIVHEKPDFVYERTAVSVDFAVVEVRASEATVTHKLRRHGRV
jgi:hypothetical protein